MNIQPFEFSIDVLRALLWRHNDAVNLQSILTDKQNALDELNKDFWESWVVDVFDLNTANEFGLAVWSVILNIPLSIDPAEPTNDNRNWGFGALRKNFNNGNFTDALTGIVLQLEEARLVLKLRFYQLVTRSTVPECNKIVSDVFDGLGSVHVLDSLDMQMYYVFDFQPSSSVRLVLEKYDLLPRPSAVKLNLIYFPNSAFGFGGFRKNFNNGNFRG